MKIKFIALVLLVISNLAHAQFFQNCVIKTNPFRLSIAWNPNLSIESQIKKSRFSISPELTYLLRTKESIGFESYCYVWSKGIQSLIGCRYYFDRKLKSPKGHYLTLQAGYTYCQITKQDYYDSDGYIYTANTTIRYPEINFAIGKQVLLFGRLSLDFLVGIRTEISPFRELHIIQSYDHKELIGTNIDRSWGTSSNLLCRLNLGILLYKNEEK